MDNIVVKSQASKDHVTDLGKTFNTLREYQMKLNLMKYAFGVTSKKFLGFMVSCRGIKANPKKSKAIQKMNPLRSIKDVQCLIEKITVLNRFVSKSVEHCLSFFKIPKQPMDFK